MRIAVALDNGEISPHFGRCAGYALYDAEEGKVVRKSFLDSPGHSPGSLPEFLREKGASCVMAGGMGPRAREIFERHGITVITGVTGNPDEAVCRYLEGSLPQTEDLCEHPHTRCTDEHNG